ncbi:MAG: hypothetical protein HFE81_04590 [Bacilli bacterium]|nr:hypothetical protein [Bacilli bacterium]
MCYLDREKKILLNRINEVSSRIDKNPQSTDSNIGEIMECYVDLATISSSVISNTAMHPYFEYLEKTYSQIIRGDYLLFNVVSRMREMILKSKVVSSKEFTRLTFFDKKEMFDILELFKNMVKTGCYPVPVSGNIRKMKKKLICDTVVMAHDIWEMKQLDETYQYDDFAAYTELKDLYESYKACLDMSDANRVGTVYDLDGAEIIDTDKSEELLMSSLEEFIKYIDDNYKYSENKDDVVIHI